MHVQRNIEQRLCNYCSSKKKAVNITYSECVFVALGIEYAMRLFVSKTFLHFISQKAYFLKKVIEHKMCVLILAPTFV
jgi:hypothetical protein